MKRSALSLFGLTLLLALAPPVPAQRLGLHELSGILPGPPRPTAAKPLDHLVLLRAEVIDVRTVTASANAARTQDGLARLGLESGQSAYYLVHTLPAIGEGWTDRLRALGAEPVSYVPRHAWVVCARSGAAAALSALPGVDLVTLYHPAHRLCPKRRGKVMSGARSVTAHVCLFAGEDPAPVVRAIRGLGGTVLEVAGNGSRGFQLRVDVPGGAVPALANIAAIQWVEEFVPPRLRNDAATGTGTLPGVPAGGIMNVEPVWQAIPDRGLDGSGMIVGHADSGLDIGVNDATLHNDFLEAAGANTRLLAAFARGRDSFAIARHPTSGLAANVASRYDAHRFEAVRAANVWKVLAWGWLDPTSSGTLHCSLWTHNAGTDTPGTLIREATNTYTVPGPIAPGSEGFRLVAFYFDNLVSVTQGTQYWVVLDRGTGAGSLTGTFGTMVDTTGGRRQVSADGATWANPSSPAAAENQLTFRVCATQTPDWSDEDGHGTHTAGSILGNGRVSPTAGQFRGPAYAAQLVHQSLGDDWGNLNVPADLGDLFAQAYAVGARIHSNSWGSQVDGEYDANCRNLDNYAWNNDDILILCPAGNGGVDIVPGDGLVDPGSMVSPAGAKNCLAVGASESVRSGLGWDDTWFNLWGGLLSVPPIRDDHVSNNPVGLSGLSGRGPCADGRVKPDLVAPGTNIVSCRSKQYGADGQFGWHPDEDYAVGIGSSSACALAAGAATLAREFFVEKRGRNPSAALLKATLVHGASDLSPGQYGLRGAIRLTFWTRHDLHAGYDYGYVEASTDGGATWPHRLGAFTGTDDTWYPVTLTMDALAGQAVRVRFRLQSDEADTAAGWWVDDVAITGAAILFSDDVEGGGANWSAAPAAGAWRRRGDTTPHSGAWCWYTGTYANSADWSLAMAFSTAPLTSAPPRRPSARAPRRPTTARAGAW